MINYETETSGVDMQIVIQQDFPSQSMSKSEVTVVDQTADQKLIHNESADLKPHILANTSNMLNNDIFGISFENDNEDIRLKNQTSNSSSQISELYRSDQRQGLIEEKADYKEFYNLFDRMKGNLEFAKDSILI